MTRPTQRVTLATKLAAQPPGNIVLAPRSLPRHGSTVAGRGQHLRGGRRYLRRLASLGLISCLLLLTGCASLPPKEPSSGHQLWQEQKCFAHMLPEWRHLESAGFRGVVFTAGSTVDEWPVSNAVVYARLWPDGRVVRTEVDGRGKFDALTFRDGLYEVAVCADGWNPWRGTVRITNHAALKSLSFPLDLGR